MHNKIELKNIIFPIEFNHLTGGMLFSAISLIKHLSKKYTVYILANEKAEIFSLDINAQKLELKNEWVISVSSPFKTFKTYFEVRQLLHKFDENNTVVFTNNVGSELIMSGFGLLPLKFKRFFVSRGGDINGKTGFVLKLGFKSVYNFIATSIRQVNVLENSGVPSSKITIIHNGIKVNCWEDFKYQFNKNDKIVISVVGYINSNKNQLLAINALYKLLLLNYKVELHIYGLAVIDSDKAYEKKIYDSIFELDLSECVMFRGFEKDIEKIYMNSDILVSCSLSEGFGRSIVEAMAFGVPCIGLKESGGLNDIIVNNVNGILISNNVDQLVASIAKICDDFLFRESLSKQARLTYVSKFTELIMCEKYSTLLKEIL